MENRKGSGIFLGVIGVATLVVAIIGATFAYFSASATNNTAITGDTAEAGGLTLTVTKLAAEGGLIPMKDNLEGTALTHNCVDTNGNTVCHVYQIALENGKSAVTISGTLSFTTNSAVTDIVYNISDINQTAAKDVEDLTPTTAGTATSSQGTLTTQTKFEADDIKYYYVVVWLHDDDTNQDAQAGKSNAYTGTVTFNAVGADGTAIKGVTATFSAA